MHKETVARKSDVRFDNSARSKKNLSSIH
jgi:hypothetical protein